MPAGKDMSLMDICWGSKQITEGLCRESKWQQEIMIAYKLVRLLKGDGDHRCKAQAGLALHVSLSWWSEEQRRSQEGEQTLGTEGGCSCKDEPSCLRQPGNRGKEPGGECWFHFPELCADAALVLRFT